MDFKTTSGIARGLLALMGFLLVVAGCSSSEGVRGSGKTRGGSGGVRGSAKPIFNASFRNGDLYKKSFALVIGIDHYDQMSELSGGVRDAEVVAEVLEEQHGMEVIKLLDGDATRRQILKAIGREMPRKLSEEDRVLIYFAGHGSTSHEGSSPLGYLMPVDAEEDDPIATGIAMSEMRGLVKNYKSKHVMFVADACFSGLAIPKTRGEGGKDAMGKSRAMDEPVFLTLVAGREQDVAREWRGHGLFTYYFIEGLRGKADLTRNGLITSDEMIAFLKDKVMTTSRREWNTEQLPQRDKEGEGEFVFWNPVWKATSSCPEGQSFDPDEGCVQTGSPFEGLQAGCMTVTECFLKARRHETDPDEARRDPAKALYFYRRACTHAHVEACGQLGKMYGEGGWGQKVVSHYSGSCEGGGFDDCYHLGKMHQEGWSMDPNPARAFKLYEKACEGDHTLACASLGTMVLRGEGTKRDLARAKGLFERACEVGNAQGCSNLGALHILGIGVDKDLKEAMSLLRRACDNGYAPACSHLGSALIDSEGDESVIAEIFRRACALGDARGCELEDDEDEVLVMKSPEGAGDPKSDVGRGSGSEDERKVEKRALNRMTRNRAVQQYEAELPRLALNHVDEEAPGLSSQQVGTRSKKRAKRKPADDDSSSDVLLKGGGEGDGSGEGESKGDEKDKFPEGTVEASAYGAAEVDVIRETILGILEEQNQNLALCGLDQLNSLPESVNVAFTVLPSGRVENSRLEAPHNQSALGDCINTTLRELDFGDLCEEPIEVAFPLKLR